ncbi:MAG: hypothetical protein HY298_13455 [Verrucomicrobia bacterium]|nr:hypothetical protein [Verrucomicrobiota bacterium]
MRRSITWPLLLLCIVPAFAARAVDGRVIKVLPHFLDAKGQHTLSPSLYERDAYQAQLRQHPEKRSAIRFDVQWKLVSPGKSPHKLRVEIRGVAAGNQPKQKVLEKLVKGRGWFSHWSALTFGGDEYKQFGEVTAWHVSLLEGDLVLAEQQSFLW